MVYLIFKKSPRELRERLREQGPRHFQNMDAYARDIEEADAYQRDVTGRDNPNRRGVVIDDGGQAERELRQRTLRSFGINNPEAYS